MGVLSKSFRAGLAMILAAVFFAGGAWAAVEKWGDTGTVAAVTEPSRTIVVEIPKGTEALTVGAELAPDAVLEAQGKAIDLSDIKAGDWVRIEWSRGEHGSIAHKIVILQPAK